MKPSDFHTLATANEGRKLPLRKPDGTATEEFLIIRSQWSDEFRKVHAAGEAKLRSVLRSKPADTAQIAQDTILNSIAALVAGWSFKEEITFDGVVEFLRNAPQIADAVNTFAADDASFFKHGLIISPDGSSQS